MLTLLFGIIGGLIGASLFQAAIWLDGRHRRRAMRMHVYKCDSDRLAPGSEVFLTPDEMGVHWAPWGVNQEPIGCVVSFCVQDGESAVIVEHY
jgi:hypothetical protein